MSRDWADLFVEASIAVWILFVIGVLTTAVCLLGRCRRDRTTIAEVIARDRAGTPAASALAKGQDAMRRRHRH